MNFTIGFSPCPNDTFIFDALINNKIDTEGLTFDAVLEDVQTLNQWAIESKLDITKLSYAVLPLVYRDYILLNSGSALGKGVGPILIANPEQEILDVASYKIAIPGENTTAHLLFSLAYPQAKQKVFLPYDEIEQFVLDQHGLGVIIHENRFTYEQKGLVKVNDLGDYWEQQTGNAIPLGGIVLKRGFEPSLQQTIDRLIRRSIEYAFLHYPELNDYIRNNAQEMSEDVMRKHIDLYVNQYSIDLGETGREAVRKLLSVYKKMNGVEIPVDQLFAGQDQ